MLKTHVRTNAVNNEASIISKQILNSTKANTQKEEVKVTHNTHIVAALREKTNEEVIRETRERKKLEEQMYDKMRKEAATQEQREQAEKKYYELQSLLA